MKYRKLAFATSPIALAVVLTSCGGSSVDVMPTDEAPAAAAGASNSTDEIDAGTSEESEEIEQVTTLNSVTGRVADGYIRGATVCVDLNESDSCEDDEPTALTGAGGIYDLDIPEGAEDKPIVADISAEAIDEDTGEAIGEPLVLVAPADRPEFVSPITTLIHQEIQSNPSLSVEDAEESVKQVLGVEESEISLFDDYVAGSDDAETGEDAQRDFSFLHDTARVVTSMMKDIEREVESAAVDSGIDVAGSVDTKRAIREIVRNEVALLLPAITELVIESYNNSNSELIDGVNEEGASQESGRVEFDPDALAISLRPDDVSVNVRDRIEAVVERTEVVAADIEQALGDGVYWLEFDCSDDDVELVPDEAYELSEEYSIDEYHEREVGGVSEELLNDDAIDADGTVHSKHEGCGYFYGHVQLNESGDELVSTNYVFDAVSGAWTEEMPSEEDDYYADFSLVDGQWLQTDESGPSGDVEFSDDGVAVVTNSEGVMVLRAASRSLGASSVLSHLRADGAEDVWYSLAQPDDMFVSGSQVNLISVKESRNSYVMFNTPSWDDEIGACLEYGDNCNVSGLYSEYGFQALSSIAEIQERAISGVQISQLTDYTGPGGTMTLLMDESNDGTLPTSGIVEWTFGYGHFVDEFDEVNEFDEDYEFVEDYKAVMYDVDTASTYYPDECYLPGAPGIPFPEDEFGESEELVTNPDEELLREEEFGFDVDEMQEEANVQSDDIDTDADFSSEPYSEIEKELLERELSENGDEIYPVCVQPGVDYTDVSNGEDSYQTGETKGESRSQSRWELIEVDGVSMIEVTMPDTSGRFDGDEQQSTLLIENDGVIRLGARFPSTYVDTVLTYNEAAFTTLRSLIERGPLGTK